MTQPYQVHVDCISGTTVLLLAKFIYFYISSKRSLHFALEFFMVYGDGVSVHRFFYSLVALVG